jgi:hypothetical protein
MRGAMRCSEDGVNAEATELMTLDADEAGVQSKIGLINVGFSGVPG